MVCIVGFPAAIFLKLWAAGGVSPRIFGSKTKNSPEEISVILHSSVSLSCDVDSHPPATITWYKDGFQVHSKDNIRIIPVPPQIKKDDLSGLGTFTKQVKVKVNTNFSLECEVKAFPRATVIWYKDGQPLGPESPLQMNGYKLHADKAQLSDTGRYTCVASNIAGEDEKDFDVIVQVPPTFLKLAGILLNADSDVSRNGDNKDVIVHNPLTLYCETNAVPPPSISWYKDGNLLTSNDKVFILPDSSSDGSRTFCSLER
ncbi:unnamed protein product [Ranitomeya imitator]|uniref:Ig-like domain-containing protein n=1 Tax=Ranitomeya imitator TaxID=111125 RepID=A0ABN9KP26_9NEOB|nr:unnamed protein product [Ranitomeya imitator]